MAFSLLTVGQRGNLYLLIGWACGVVAAHWRRPAGLVFGGLLLTFRRVSCMKLWELTFILACESFVYYAAVGVYWVRRVCLHISSPLVFFPPGKAGHVYHVDFSWYKPDAAKISEAGIPPNSLLFSVSLWLCFSFWEKTEQRGRANKIASTACEHCWSFEGFRYGFSNVPGKIPSQCSE